MSAKANLKETGIYLGKSGKAYGPYSEAEMEELLARKDLHFTWIWSHAESCWKPIEPPPPPLKLDAKPERHNALESREFHPAGEPQAPLFQAPQPLPEPVLQSVEGFTAVCHDFRHMICGTIRNVTELGCELISLDAGAGPTFTQKGNMVMNLLDEKNGRSINVSVKLADVTRDRGNWAYRVRWEGCPEILRAA